MPSFFKRIALFVLISGFCALSPVRGSSAPAMAAQEKSAELRQILDKVYKTMDENYYGPVSREIYEDFLKNYTAEKLEALNDKTKQTENFIHLGAGLLVNKLKSPSDHFTNFIPPKKTKAFKEHAYAVTEDLGIEGSKSARGFEITKVEKHCDAYLKGIRKGDIILKIDGEDVKLMDESAIRKKLTPPVGTIVRLEVLFIAENEKKQVELESRSYFKETVFVTPVKAPGILVLKITHFNQKTSEDFEEELVKYKIENIKKLVIDLRDNEGGPPLAAREILGYFLPPSDHLFAVVKKRQRPVMMTSPSKTTLYKGPLAVLVDKKTGSAAEMFGGILQAKDLASLVGQSTAGGCYLKGIFDLEDRSAIFMITSLTYFYDHRVFPPEGLTPDVSLPEGKDALETVLAEKIDA